jgi:hypothetical protein
MRIKNLQVPNSRLTEGSWHDFKILKEVFFNSNEESFFIMQDPLGYKVMMPADFYQQYGFKPGQMIRCRVDKINCNGRMFLEPQHPFYKEGNSYNFTLKGAGNWQNLTGETESFFYVEDVLGYKWKVRSFSSNDDYENKGIIKCHLERIKKGKLFLRKNDDNHPYKDLKKAEYYPFTIIGETINTEDNSRYLILEDEKKRKHVLKKKYFSHYRLKPKQIINCKINGFNEDGFLLLEPENPWYKEGEQYTFNTIEINKLHFSDGTVQNVLLLDDPHGEPIKVFINPNLLPVLENQSVVKTKLLNVRKSRLEVLITEPQA